MREHLVRDFPACVVPALPGKHRIGEPATRSIIRKFTLSQSTLQEIGSAQNSWKGDASSTHCFALSEIRHLIRPLVSTAFYNGSPGIPLYNEAHWSGLSSSLQNG